MDFIPDLPQYGGFNGVYTCVNKLTKFIKFVPILIGEGALLALEVACLFFEHVVQLFGIPCLVLYNYNAYSTAHFWRCLWVLLGSRVALSLAHHL